MKLFTQELIVLEKTEKDFECNDGKTRHYYNLKVGSPDYENITFSVKEDVYNMIEKGDRVNFMGHFGGLKNPFWGIDEVIRLNGDDIKKEKSKKGE